MFSSYKNRKASVCGATNKGTKDNDYMNNNAVMLKKSSETEHEMKISNISIIHNN